ncbi:MAG: prohibitin family protein [Planctomycetota bacterium]|nr:prohibitin family protein [Planctomycetota bacterium]
MGSIILLVLLIAGGLLSGVAALRVRHKADPDAMKARFALLMTSVGTLGLAAVLGVYRCVVVVPPGSVGVPVVFGRVVNEPMRDGLHFLAPWYNLEIMNARTQSYTMSHVHEEGVKGGDDSITVLSGNGMEMKLDVTVTYRLLPQAAPWVYRNLGENYEDRMIRPGIGTAIREAASKFSDEEVYGEKREELAQAMLKRLDVSLQKTIQGDYTDAPTKVFSVSNVLVRNILLPTAVTEGINRKLVMKQESERMEFQIARDKKEADRKVIEAKGIQDSQAIIAKGITPDYLTWKSIEATEMLARSPNAKIIIIGNTKNGLPIMLDQSVPPSPGALTAEEKAGHSRMGATSGTNNTN